jgi:putative transposase
MLDSDINPKKITMKTYTQVIYQLVFGTKHRQPTLAKSHRDELFMYISGYLENNRCHLYRINGVEDHLHILTDIHTTIAVATLIKDIKLSSTDFIKRKNLFTGFKGWQEGFGAFTYSIREKDTLIEYVKNQEAHHRKVTFKEEYIQLLKDNEVEFDERYLM